MNSSAPLLDFIASAQARDEGMERVVDNNNDWARLAFIQLEQISHAHGGWANTEHGVMGEDIRCMLTPRIGKPSSPHAWGALTNAAIRKGLIVATGQYRSMKDVRSHARKTAIYVFKGK
jgi:hypothetical protein